VRILVTVPWGERLGGAEAMLQMLLDGAEQGGAEFELVFLQDGPWPRELAGAGFKVHVVAVGRLRQAHRTLLAIPRLARIMRRSRPDVILNWSAKTQLYGAPAAMLAGLSGRVVWWQQVIPRGHWLDRLATALPAVAVGCYSQAAADAQSRMRPSRPTFVVAAGTPRPEPSRRRAGLELPAGVPVVGLVGRLQAWKGQDRLLRAQKILAERGQRAHVLIVGGDSYGLEPEYARSLKALSERLGLAGAVTMTGEVPDAGPYIERMDVLVNASDPEPFGIVLLEGMARGVAVAAVDSGGPAEFIEHGRTGVLARSGEPADLADALEPLLRSPERRWAIGAAGHERFLEDFTDSAMRDRFFFQFNKIIKEKK
jgi:glycosyltransferase involved in cell wall biosynthesis